MQVQGIDRIGCIGGVEAALDSWVGMLRYLALQGTPLCNYNGAVAQTDACPGTMGRALGTDIAVPLTGIQHLSALSSAPVCIAPTYPSQTSPGSHLDRSATYSAKRFAHVGLLLS